MGKHRSEQEWIELFELFDKDFAMFERVYLDQFPTYQAKHSAYYRFREKYREYKVRDVKTKKAKENAKQRLPIPAFYLGKVKDKEGSFHLTARGIENYNKQLEKETRANCKDKDDMNDSKSDD